LVRVVSPLVSSPARRRSRRRSALSVLVLGAGALLAGALLIGLAFSGSRAELAAGTRVAGVDVGGLTREQAVGELERRFDRVADQPVAFVAAGERFELSASQLAVAPDFRAAVSAAAAAGDGFAPLRGFRRLHTRFFGAEVLPRLAVSSAALEYALDRIAAEVDREPESAALVRRGLRIEVVPARSGRRLEREAAAEAVVRALGALERAGGPVVLPVSTATPPVSEEALAAAARRARIALSAPVVLRGAGRSWRLPRWRIARLRATAPPVSRSRAPTPMPTSGPLPGASAGRPWTPPLQSPASASGSFPRGRESSSTSPAPHGRSCARRPRLRSGWRRSRSCRCSRSGRRRRRWRWGSTGACPRTRPSTRARPTASRTCAWA
jgi:hypothetical protein